MTLTQYHKELLLFYLLRWSQISYHMIQYYDGVLCIYGAACTQVHHVLHPHIALRFPDIFSVYLEWTDAICLSAWIMTTTEAESHGTLHSKNMGCFNSCLGQIWINPFIGLGLSIFDLDNSVDYSSCNARACFCSAKEWMGNNNVKTYRCRHIQLSLSF